MPLPVILHTTVAQPAVGTNLAVTIPSTTAGSCLFVVLQGAYSDSSGAPSVTGMTIGGLADNFAQVINNAFNSTVDALWNFNIVWADPSCAGGKTALSIAVNAAIATAFTLDVTVYQVSNIPASAILDRSSSNTGQLAANGTWTSLTTAATTVADEFWLGVAYSDSGLNVPATGWTDSGINALDSAAGCGSQVVSATGTATYTDTIGPNPAGYAAAVLTFKSTGAAATPALVTTPVGKGRSAAMPGRSSVARAPAAPVRPATVPAPRRPPSGAHSGRSAVARPVPAPGAGRARPTSSARRPPPGNRPGRSIMIKATGTTVIPPPVISGPPQVNPDILKPWRKRPWPRVALSADLDFPATHAPGVLDDPHSSPDAGPQVPATPPPGLRVQAEAIVTGLTRRAARTVDTGNVLDADLAESLLYWQQYQKRKKGK